METASGVDVAAKRKKKPWWGDGPWRGFGSFDAVEHLKLSARGGSEPVQPGKKRYRWTARSARVASLKRQGLTESPFPTRKRIDENDKVHHEYQVMIDGERRWISRQRVYLLRKQGKL